MSVASAPSAPSNADACAAIVRQLAALDRVARMGMLIAEAVGRGFLALVAGRGGLGRAVRVFERVSRAVRLAFALQLKLCADLDRLRSSAPSADPPPRAADRPAVERAPAVERDVERAEQTERGDGREPHDRFGPILRRPVEEVIARICRDLGVFPEWRRLVEDAWARPDADLPQIAELPAAPAARSRARPASRARDVAPSPAWRRGASAGAASHPHRSPA